MGLFTINGKILVDANGRIIFDDDCCCKGGEEECEGACTEDSDCPSVDDCKCCDGECKKICMTDADCPDTYCCKDGCCDP